MNLKTYSYSLLIFISVGNNNSSAQKEHPQNDCGQALKQYNTDIEKIVRSSTELMYSASDFKNNKVSEISDDSYVTFENFNELDTVNAWSAMERILHYNKDVEKILNLQSYAYDGITNTYLKTTKGKDCL